MISAKVIADSVSLAGARIITLELQYPRFIHGEVMTHRVFSRNAMSSRAIPVAKMIAQVRNSPAMPVYWGANQPGMQAAAELTGTAMENAKFLWLRAAQQAADIAEDMEKIGLHKQIANRVLEPFQWMRTIVTSTEWTNFFELRAHPDAQPEFQTLARVMQPAMAESEPVLRAAGWHLPYVTAQERCTMQNSMLLKISAARCARVSYLTHDGKNPDIHKDVALFDRLVGSVPLHASPIEHQAWPMVQAGARSNNFFGWGQYRADVERDMRAATK